MAVVFDVVYPNTERAYAVGYPVAGTTVRVDIVPEGPEACLGDLLEVDFAFSPCPVRRIAGGPRRKTVRVRLPSADPRVVEPWLEARDAEGFETRQSDVDATIALVVPVGDNVDLARLTVDGAVVLG